MDSKQLFQISSSHCSVYLELAIFNQNSRDILELDLINVLKIIDTSFVQVKHEITHD